MATRENNFGVYFFFLFMLFFLSSMPILSAISENKVEKEVFNFLDEDVEIPVIVRFNTINDTLRDSVLISLSSSEFNLDRKNLRGERFNLL